MNKGILSSYANAPYRRYLLHHEIALREKHTLLDNRIAEVLLSQVDRAHILRGRRRRRSGFEIHIASLDQLSSPVAFSVGAHISDVTATETSGVFGQTAQLALVQVFGVVAKDENATGIGGSVKVQGHVEATEHRWIQILLAVCGSDNDGLATLLEAFDLAQQDGEDTASRLVHVVSARGGQTVDLIDEDDGVANLIASIKDRAEDFLALTVELVHNALHGNVYQGHFHLRSNDACGRGLACARGAVEEDRLRAVGGEDLFACDSANIVVELRMLQWEDHTTVDFVLDVFSASQVIPRNSIIRCVDMQTELMKFSEGMTQFSVSLHVGLENGCQL
mmetsp:Transcript_13728/g.41413  ORF Transcript_13728/g.41413 Transcript_13728/m.41413 type:complete len:335 (+) Transcript_13728:53-1057(+)